MRDNHIRILCSVLNVDIVYETADGSLTAFFDNSKESPLMQSQALRQIMREGTAAQSSIFLRHNTYDCYFAGLHAGDGYIYMGPMAHQRLTSAQRRRMYRAYGIDSEDLSVLPVFTLPQIRNMALLANTVLENASLENEELLQLNRIITKEEKQIQQEQTAFTMREEEVDDDEAYRHSYHEEQLVLQAVREGRAEDAIRISEDMDRDSGRLARTDIRHRRYVAIIGITLCSRAAIEGGVSPASVYRISGYYINKCDETEDPAHMLLYRNRAIEELAGRVREGLNAPRGSSYVERCRDHRPGTGSQPILPVPAVSQRDRRLHPGRHQRRTRVPGLQSAALLRYVTDTDRTLRRLSQPELHGKDLQKMEKHDPHGLPRNIQETRRRSVKKSVKGVRPLWGGV